MGKSSLYKPLLRNGNKTHKTQAGVSRELDGMIINGLSMSMGHDLKISNQNIEI